MLSYLSSFFTKKTVPTNHSLLVYASEPANIYQGHPVSSPVNPFKPDIILQEQDLSDPPQDNDMPGYNFGGDGIDSDVMPIIPKTDETDIDRLVSWVKTHIVDPDILDIIINDKVRKESNKIYYKFVFSLIPLMCTQLRYKNGNMGSRIVKLNYMIKCSGSEEVYKKLKLDQDKLLDYLGITDEKDMMVKVNDYIFQTY